MTKTFVEFEDPYADLAEIEQSGSLKFAFATKVAGEHYRTQHLFVKCRDFLNDAVIATDGEYRTPMIYGFTYDGENDPIDRDKTRLILRMSATERSRFIPNLKKFNNMLHSAGVERTRAYRIQLKNKPSNFKYLLVEGDSRWANHVTAMSFYSLMIRIATTNRIVSSMSFARYVRNRDCHSHNDRNYLNDFNKMFRHPAHFIKNMELLSMRDVHLSVDRSGEMEGAHEHGGIQMFCNLMNGWKENYIRDLLSDHICCWDYQTVQPDDDIAIDHFPTITDARRMLEAI